MEDTIKPTQLTSEAPSAAQWQAQKDTIWNLYRVKNLTHKQLALELTKLFGCRVTYPCRVSYPAMQTLTIPG